MFPVGILFCLRRKKKKKKNGKAPENCQRKTTFGVDIWRLFKHFLRTPCHCPCVFTHADQRQATAESSVTNSGHPINRQKYAPLASRMIALLSHNSTWTLEGGGEKNARTATKKDFFFVAVRAIFFHRPLTLVNCSSN